VAIKRWEFPAPPPPATLIIAYLTGSPDGGNAALCKDTLFLAAFSQPTVANIKPIKTSTRLLFDMAGPPRDSEKPCQCRLDTGALRLHQKTNCRLLCRVSCLRFPESGLLNFSSPPSRFLLSRGFALASPRSLAAIFPQQPCNSLPFQHLPGPFE